MLGLVFTPLGQRNFSSRGASNVFPSTPHNVKTQRGGALLIGARLCVISSRRMIASCFASSMRRPLSSPATGCRGASSLSSGRADRHEVPIAHFLLQDFDPFIGHPTQQEFLAQDFWPEGQHKQYAEAQLGSTAVT